MDGMTMKNWKARRAGGRITVYGTDTYTGRVVKITNVDEITPPESATEHYVTAVDNNGNHHKLIFG